MAKQSNSFTRNWFQENMWAKGITFACTNEHFEKGAGRLCWNCGTFHPGENVESNWICNVCKFEHKVMA